MQKTNIAIQKNELSNFDYSRFFEIDGSHPLKVHAPDSFIEYEARRRHGGTVAFFNFELAREMGLIEEGHPDLLTPELEEIILETFSIQIINEYDQLHHVKIPKSDLLNRKYMATRYLQLQHPSKKGTTSGDGRSVWNGQITHKGKTWDLSSCGTGATKLSPATNINHKFYQTGDPTISYGCGYSEKDEGIAALFFSEVLAQNHYETERVLGIIEFQKGISINIRAARNLIRPSHFFCHLKQNNLTALYNLIEYYIKRMEKDNLWKKVPKTKKARYNFFLNEISYSFAKMAAKFEDDYIFCWLDWDGDNILMNGGIIDYGSVRQFGLFHHEYRYDDVQRYSTTILEQKAKARYIVQCFAQMTNFLITGKKKNIKTFSTHSSLKKFDQVFVNEGRKNLLYKIGFEDDEAAFLISKKKRTVDSFKKVFSHFERTKSKRGMRKVPDGITWDAVFCMRDILRELPQLYLIKKEEISPTAFLDILKSNYAKPADLKLTAAKNKMINLYQKNYRELVSSIARSKKRHLEEILLSISARSAVINKYDRITGDSITNIANKVLEAKPKLNPIELQDLVHQFKGLQDFTPGHEKVLSLKNEKQKRYINGMLKIVREFSEGL